jgi:hypothetical protein
MGELQDALNGFDLEMGLDGEMLFTKAAGVKEKEPGKKEEKEKEIPGDTKRLKDTQSALTGKSNEVKQLTGTVKELIATLNQKATSEEATKIPTAESLVEEGETPMDVLSDSQRGLQFLTSLVREAVADDAASRPESKEAALRKELDVVVAANPDFQDYIVAINTLVKKHPTLSFQNAYDLAVEQAGTESQESGKADDEEKPDEIKAAPTEEELKVIEDKAGKLKTEQGIASEGLEVNTGDSLTIKGAVLESIDELGI